MFLAISKVSLVSGLLAISSLFGNSYAALPTDLTIDDIYDIQADTASVTKWGADSSRLWVELPTVSGGTTWVFTTSPMVASALTALKAIGSNSEVRFQIDTVDAFGPYDKIENLFIDKITLPAPDGVVERIWMKGNNPWGGLDFADLSILRDINGIPKALVLATPDQVSIAVTSLAKTKPVVFSKGSVIIFNNTTKTFSSFSSVAEWVDLTE